MTSKGWRKWTDVEERVAFALAAEGFTDAEIGRLLGRSRSSVMKMFHHRRNGYRGGADTGLGLPYERHGYSSHPLYKTYMTMVARCLCPGHPDYHDYGGRDIGLYPSFNPLTPGESGGPQGVGRGMRNYLRACEESGWFRGCGLTMHRIDNDLDYAPGNLRPATKAEQSRERRDSRLWRKTPRRRVRRAA